MSQSKAELVAPVGIFTASGINVTGVVTASSFEGDGSQLQGVGIGTTGSINSSGIITASAFYGSGIGLTGITLLGPTNSYETTGIITASAFYGDGIGITNIGGPLSPISYSPGIGQTNVGVSTNIVITFNKPIAAAAATSGIATITLRTDAADGTIVESFDIADSAQLSISGGVLTITPSAAMAGFTTHFLVIPAGTLQDTIDTSDNVGITTYSFTTQQLNYEFYTWGYGNEGQIGNNTSGANADFSSPVQVPGTQWNYEKSSSGRAHTSALKSDSTLWVWGGNQYGALGQNDIVPRSSPVQIPGTQWTSTSSAYWSTYAIKTDGTLWSWGGFNAQGALGLNDTLQYSSPVQIPGTQWSKVDGGLYNTAALKTDGTLWIWGRNQHGESGLNDKVARSSPTQIPGTQWSHIDIGGYSTYAIKTDGTLWSWGYNPGGQLGQNDRVNRSSPTQVPGTQWASGDFKTNGQYLYTHLIKTDGTLWACGYNDNGVLGQNATTRRSSPTQIPGTNWSAVAGADSGALAIKDDGTLWSWGTSADGIPGQNDAVSRSSPTQIPGTQWISVSRPNYSRHNIAIKEVAL